MKKLFVLLAITAFMCIPAMAQSGKVNNFRIKRGTNVSHWLSQSEARGEMRRLHIQEEDFERLHDLGFDFVRIPIDEVQFWDEKGNKLPEAWTLLTNALKWARKHELRAIVDLHIVRSHYFNAVNEGGGAANTLFTSEKSQQDLINLWYQLSDVLKDYSTDWVAYEFMNEPVADEHEQWNKLVAKVHKALRAREPQRTLVVGSNRWQGYETMKYLRVPEGDKNIVLSFHYYNPMILTHNHGRLQRRHCRCQEIRSAAVLRRMGHLREDRQGNGLSVDKGYADCFRRVQHCMDHLVLRCRLRFLGPAARLFQG